MLNLIVSKFGLDIINGMFKTAGDAFTAYQNKQISIEELRARMVVALVQSVRDVEVAHADDIAKTFASFMGAVVQSKILQIGWLFVLVVETCVLAWVQVGIPALVTFDLVKTYAPAGSTIDWAYLLIAFCLGGGPIILRSGPGKMDPERMKTLIQK